MKVYIASSWKNKHAVEMLTWMLRAKEHTVLSFVENNFGEHEKDMPFDSWCNSRPGEQSFRYDTGAATESDLVIYIGPSGTDAWAEVGAAWASGIPIYGLYAKGEQSGLMRRMVRWFDDYDTLLMAVSGSGHAFVGTVPPLICANEVAV